MSYWHFLLTWSFFVAWVALEDVAWTWHRFVLLGNSILLEKFSLKMRQGQNSYILLSTTLKQSQGDLKSHKDLSNGFKLPQMISRILRLLLMQVKRSNGHPTLTLVSVEPFSVVATMVMMVSPSYLFTLLHHPHLKFSPPSPWLLKSPSMPQCICAACSDSCLCLNAPSVGPKPSWACFFPSCFGE